MTPFSICLVSGTKPPLIVVDAKFTRVDCPHCHEDLDDSAVVDVGDLLFAPDGTATAPPVFAFHDQTTWTHLPTDRVICKHCHHPARIASLSHCCPAASSRPHRMHSLTGRAPHDSFHVGCTCGWHGDRHPRMKALPRRPASTC